MDNWWLFTPLVCVQREDGAADKEHRCRLLITQSIQRRT